MFTLNEQVQTNSLPSIRKGISLNIHLPKHNGRELPTNHENWDPSFVPMVPSSRNHSNLFKSFFKWKPCMLTPNLLICSYINGRIGHKSIKYIFHIFICTHSSKF